MSPQTASKPLKMETRPLITAGRKRKAHQKSRRGCGNCKIRRVKCDETHPKCHKCVSYGVSCDFNNDVKAHSWKNESEGLQLDFSNDDSFQVIEFSLPVRRNGSDSVSSISEPSTISSTSEHDSDSDTSHKQSSALMSSRSHSRQQWYLTHDRNGYQDQRHDWIDHRDHDNNYTFYPTPSVRLTSPSVSLTLLAMFDFDSNESRQPSRFKPNLNTLSILDRFQARTATTIGSASNWNEFRKEIMGLVWSHEHLLHVLLTLTLMHDRYLSSRSPATDSDRAKFELETQAYHWYRGTYLFNRILGRAITAKSNIKSIEPLNSDGPHQPNQDEIYFNQVRPSLWPCAALLGAVVFNEVDPNRSSSSLWDIWPLKSYGRPEEHNENDDDLEWLKMSEGKHVVWNLASPLGSGSPLTGVPAQEPEEVQRVMKAANHDLQMVEEGSFGLKEVQDLNKRLPDGLGELFFSSAILSSPTWLSSQQDQVELPISHGEILKSSDDVQDFFRKIHAKDDASAYLPPLIILSYIIPLLCTHTNVLIFLNFIYQLSPDYITLLRQKDPRAMLLLAMWYAKLSEYGGWWVQDRAVREGQGICLWLELMASREDIADSANHTEPYESPTAQRTREQIKWARQIATTQPLLIDWIREKCH